MIVRRRALVALTALAFVARAATTHRPSARHSCRRRPSRSSPSHCRRWRSRAGRWRRSSAISRSRFACASIGQTSFHRGSDDSLGQSQWARLCESGGRARVRLGVRGQLFTPIPTSRRRRRSGFTITRSAPPRPMCTPGWPAAISSSTPSCRCRRGSPRRGLSGPNGAAQTIIPLAIQDRSFDVDGRLFYPANSNGGTQWRPNPEHPYWSPEIFLDTITVNGKVWPFLDVEPKRYRFLVVDGAVAVGDRHRRGIYRRAGRGERRARDDAGRTI